MTLARVLDSSAVLAWLQQEPGGEPVGELLEDGMVGAANWAEILQKTRQRGADPHEVGLLLRSLGVEVVDVTRVDAEHAASIWQKGLTLSLGDRLCLGLGKRLQLPVVTLDALWEDVSASAVEVQVLTR